MSSLAIRDRPSITVNLDMREINALLRIRRGNAALVNCSSGEKKLSTSNAPAIIKEMPEVLLEALHRRFRRVELERILSLDFVRTWKGWQEFLKIDRSSMTTAAYAEKVQEHISRISRIVLENLDVTAKSDNVRQVELKAKGKMIGVGIQHGTNDCLTDSLIQALSASGLLPSTLAQDVAARKKARAEVREYLANHEDHRVHPTWKTSMGEIAEDREITA